MPTVIGLTTKHAVCYNTLMLTLMLHYIANLFIKMRNYFNKLSNTGAKKMLICVFVVRMQH